MPRQLLLLLPGPGWLVAQLQPGMPTDCWVYAGSGALEVKTMASPGCTCLASDFLGNFTCNCWGFDPYQFEVVVNPDVFCVGRELHSEVRWFVRFRSLGEAPTFAELPSYAFAVFSIGVSWISIESLILSSCHHGFFLQLQCWRNCYAASPLLLWFFRGDSHVVASRGLRRVPTPTLFRTWMKLSLVVMGHDGRRSEGLHGISILAMFGRTMLPNGPP